MLSLTSLQWTGAAVAALLVGLSKAGFGAGAGILAVPLMVTVLGSAEMLPVMLMVLLVGDVLALAHYRRDHSVGNLAVLVPGMLAGVVAGALVLEWFLGLPDGELWLRRAIGFIAVAFVLVQLHRQHEEPGLSSPQVGFRPQPWQGVLLGAGSGLASTLAHAGGPPIVLYLLPQRLNKRVFVGTIVKFFFIANLVKVVPYAWQGLFTVQRAAVAGALVPAVLVGTVAGAFVRRRVSDRLFRAAVYCLAFALGVYLLSGWQPGSGQAGRQSAFGAGLRAYAQQQFAEAARLFEQAAGEEGPRAAAAHFNQGIALYGAGRYRAATAPLEEAWRAGPPPLAARAAYNLGNCAYRRGEFRTAVGHYRTALRRASLLWEADGLRRRERNEVAELARRAAANLALACDRVGRAEPDRLAQPAQDSHADSEQPEDGIPVTRVGNELGGERTPPQRPRPGPGSGTAGERTVEEVLRGADRGDLGPVIRSGNAPRPADGPDW